MRILITNDDGINAPGLKVLEGIANELAGPYGGVWDGSSGSFPIAVSTDVVLGDDPSVLRPDAAHARHDV